MSARSSTRPAARATGPPGARTSSLLGALKNLVVAPLTWFGSALDDSNETPGEKRPRRPQQVEDVDQQDPDSDEHHRLKRKRIHSPEPEVQHFPQTQPSHQSYSLKSGYLDPPQSLLNRPSLTGSISAPYIRSSTAVPTSSGRAHQRNRLSLSPRPSTAHGKPSGIPRTQSMDPPGRLLIPPPSRPPPLSRGASLMSIDDPLSSPAGDAPTSPGRPRFKLRTSLTPQPSGPEFGPTPVRRERDVSEPPPLEALMENPIFVKAPPNPEPATRSAPLTLGSLVESRGTAQPLTRQRSNLITGLQAGALGDGSDSKSGLRPVNAAEIALHELEVYKTPLLPSRLRGSSAIPDMFKPKKSRQTPPLLMRDDRGERPRLGLSEPKGAKKSKATKDDAAKTAKPYSGQSGMKKLLARRRLEEEEEKEKERETAIVTDEEDHAQEREMLKANVAAEKKLVKDLETPLSGPALGAPVTLGGKPQSSLRVGRTRISRNHIPAARPKSKNKFSAVYDEDEPDDLMANDEAEAKTIPVIVEPPSTPKSKYEAPKGFSFTKDTSPIQHDVTKAKEPPLPSLPFSLFGQPVSTSNVPTAPSVPPLFSAPPPTPPTVVAAASTVPATPAPPPPSFGSVPSIALIPPTPAAKRDSESLPAQPSTGSGSSVPNFFASSSIFSKPGAQLPFSLTPSSTATPSPPVLVPPSNLSWGERSEPAAPKVDPPSSSVFGAPAKPVEKSSQSQSIVAPAPLFSTGPTTPAPSAPLLGSLAPPTSVKEDTPAATSPFSGSSASSSFFGPKTGTSTSSLFGAITTPTPPAEAPTAAPRTPSFSFGALPKPVEPSAVAAPASSSFSFGAATKPAETPAPVTSPFSFGAPKPEAKSTTEATDALKPATPLLPTPAAPAPLFPGFGAPTISTTATPPPVEPPKPFAFGQPTAGTAPSLNEPPKSLFGAASAATGSSPFSFASSQPAPLPAVSTPPKPAFTFGAPTPAPAPAGAASLFGVPSSGSNGTDVSKGFSFGAGPTTPSRPLTPPKGDGEMSMDESPIRPAGMDLNGGGKTIELMKPTAGFGFGGSGAGASSSFGQNTASTSTFSFGSPSSPANPFGAKPTEKPGEKPALSFGGFGQQSSSSGPFAFSASNTSQTTQPAASSPFGFGAPPTTPTSTASPFGFGSSAPAPAPSNPFGQPSSNSTASTAPAFGSSAPAFSFAPATPTSAPSNPFSFGSQPGSPATPNAGLPPTSSGGFVFGQPSTATQQPGSPSPFGSPAQASGGALFTMGAAPPPTPGMASRPLKKLPSRRGGKR